MNAYVAGEMIYFPPQYGFIESWFDEWMNGIYPRDKKRTPNRKWIAFTMWNGMWNRVPIEIEKLRLQRPTL